GWLGYIVLFAVIFAESGLLIGFFLPGDSLLFTVGVVAGAGKLPIGTMIVMLATASILGDGIGFYQAAHSGIPCSKGRRAVSSAANTLIAHTRSTSGMAARPSFMRNLFLSSALSRPL